MLSRFRYRSPNNLYAKGQLTGYVTVGKLACGPSVTRWVFGLRCPSRRAKLIEEGTGPNVARPAAQFTFTFTHSGLFSFGR